MEVAFGVAVLGWLLWGLAYLYERRLHERAMTLERERGDRLIERFEKERAHLLNRIQDPVFGVQQSVQPDGAARSFTYGEAAERSLGEIDRDPGEIREDFEKEIKGVNDELMRRGIDPSEL